MNRRVTNGTLVSAGVIGLIILLIPKPLQRTSGLIHQDAYVWQRSWTESVQKAVRRQGNQFSNIIVLAAEVSGLGQSLRVARVSLDYDALAQLETPVGLALRVGSFSGPFSRNGKPVEQLLDLGESLLDEALSNGLKVAEFHLDFDCAERQLDGFCRWVEAFQMRLQPTRVTITALPAWLDRRAFRRLISVTDGYVLQVHSLERPQTASQSFTLCEPRAAIAAVERAARLGKPFRVALPTYGYTIAFDSNNKFAGLMAENRNPDWPAEFHLQKVRTDPAQMANLVRQWTQDRPAQMAGIIWYRLPVGTDRLNWAWPTLSNVMAGVTPHPEIVAEAQYPDPGLVEIAIRNCGEAEGPTPSVLRLRWRDARLVASDGQAGYISRPVDNHELELRLQMNAFELRPGESQIIGWLRFESPVKVKIEMVNDDAKPH